MRGFRTLYATIFGWFWLTLIVGALLVLAITAFTGSQPLGRRWMRLTQDMYAHSAVDFYETGGAPALRQYLATLRDSSGMQASLLDEHQQDVLGSALPPDVDRVLQQSIKTGQSNFHLGRVWTAATPVSYGPRRFLFVVEVHPLRGFFDGTFAIPALNRLVLALLVAGVFCAILTRHIVAPVRALKAAALRLAAGDLGTRVFPVIAPREDELADTAKAFDQMADRMQHLIQKRQELLADISHELRSPLTRISVSLELMRRGETDVVEQMQMDLDRINAMIGQILLLTRLDLQPSQADSERIELKGMLESIAQDAEFEGQNEDKTVLVHVEGNCWVRGDANLLRSCIENIVRNAIRYTAAHSSVEITATVARDVEGHSRCEIAVIDCGPGVPDASLPFIFDPFYRVSESRDHDEGGTGLGLSIAQKIVDLHHGTIKATNRDDAKGLVIQLSFPSA